ncbi:MAG: copper-binding protein [Acidobacteriota bacterium]
MISSRPHTRSPRRLADSGSWRPGLGRWLFAGLCGIAVLTGCGGDAATAPDATYETRGIVRQLPDASLPGSELMVHHEAIDSFVDSSGETVGMGSMAMPFPLADAAMLEGLEVGDRVRMVFTVDWDGSPPLEVIELEALPADSRLSFEQGLVRSIDFESGDLEALDTSGDGASDNDASDAQP